MYLLCLGGRGGQGGWQNNTEFFRANARVTCVNLLALYVLARTALRASLVLKDLRGFPAFLREYDDVPCKLGNQSKMEFWYQEKEFVAGRMSGIKCLS